MRLAQAIEAIADGATWHAAMAHAAVPDADAARFRLALARALRGGKRAEKAPAAPKPGADGADVIIAHADGGSRGNPGPAACAAILYDAGGEELLRRGALVGRLTNNTAEYEGVLLALQLAKTLGACRVVLRIDSELVVKQIQGSYKVRHADLKPYHTRVMELVRGFGSFTVEHVRREKNKAADALVNATLDGKEE